uniref:Beta-amylase n=1 Tax=Brassica campestris TaxID=3711 RepID=M4EPZ0_BRACM
MEDINRKEKLFLNYVPVYIVLPLFGIVAKDNKHAELETTERNLKRLKKEACIDGVMVDVWWGIVESKAPKEYNWNGYKELFKMVKRLELKIHAIMSFHKSSQNRKTTSLPSWVVQVGKENPDIYYTDRKGFRNDECLSLGVDNEPLFDDVNGTKRTAIQCYDKYLKKDFENAAKKAGHSMLDLSKEDFGDYNSKPDETTFFKENGTYTTEKGEFFLEWYSNKLIIHGDQILREANKIFTGLKIDLVAKVSGVHWLYYHPSHGAELTAGYYNLYDRDGYRPIARMLYKRNCFLNFSCLEMKYYNYSEEALSAPEELVKAVLSKAWKEGIEVIGANTSEIKNEEGYNQVLLNARPNGSNPKGKPKLKVHSFMYLRLSETIFSRNYDMFKKFVRNMHADQDYCGDAEKYAHKVESNSAITIEEILAATKSSGSFKWDEETEAKVDG